MAHMRGTARHDRLVRAGLSEPQRGQARGPAPDALAGEVEPRLEGAHVVPNGGGAPAHLLPPHEPGQGPNVGPGGGTAPPLVGPPACRSEERSCRERGEISVVAGSLKKKT